MEESPLTSSVIKKFNQPIGSISKYVQFWEPEELKLLSHISEND